MTNTPDTSNTPEGYSDEFEDRDYDTWPEPPELDATVYDAADLPPLWHPDEDIPADPAPLDTTEGDHPFWDARPELRIIHDYAKAQMASPHAVMACALARVVAATPHTVVLPPTIGGLASLNLFVGFVAESGGGKGIAEKVAGKAVFLSGGCDFIKNGIVSGEAFTHLFATRRREAQDGETGLALVRTNYNALITIGEIDQLAGLRQRQGSTIMSALRSVAMGEHLGGGAATEDRKVWVEALTYRCCLLVGVQPARSGALFGDADGGTPQRFLFVAANDPEAVMDAPLPAMGYRWMPPDWSLAPAEYDREAGTEFRILRLPDVAIEATRRIQWEKNRGLCDPLDGHRNLLRLKVAAALAILAGRMWMDEEDWRLSDFLMTHSDRQRDRCRSAIAESHRRAAVVAGRAEAHKVMAMNEEQEDAILPAVRDRALGLIRKSGPEGIAEGMIAKPLSKPQRPYLAQALGELTARGTIETFEGKSGNNRPCVRYRVVAHCE